MTLSELEQKVGVIFPAKFHAIHATGAMEWMELSLAEFRENRDHYLNDPTAFMMLNCDCEPLFFEEVPPRMDELSEWLRWREEDEKQVPKEGVSLIPFAQTGGGDLYCFLYEEGRAEPAVILYLHDSYGIPDVIGDTFDQFLYRMMLQAAAFAEDIDDIDGTHWEAHLQYLTEEYRAKLLGKDADELTDMYYDDIWQDADIFSEIE